VVPEGVVCGRIVDGGAWGKKEGVSRKDAKQIRREKQEVLVLSGNCACHRACSRARSAPIATLTRAATFNVSAPLSLRVLSASRLCVKSFFLPAVPKMARGPPSPCSSTACCAGTSPAEAGEESASVSSPVYGGSRCAAKLLHRMGAIPRLRPLAPGGPSAGPVCGRRRFRQGGGAGRSAGPPRSVPCPRIWRPGPGPSSRG
jgi:hypothetical protein